MAKIHLSDHFSYGRLLRFTWPSMIMMVVISVYGVVDGVMVSNFAGTTSFAALNLIWPFVGILASIGFMFGTGGSALVAKILGEGDGDKARDIFTLLTFITFAIGAVLGLAGLLVVRHVAELLGAEGYMLEESVRYASILLVMLPSYVMQVYFQSLMIAAELPKTCMWITIGAGVMNMVLDVLFIGVFRLGIVGAAWATAASQCVASIVPFLLLSPWFRKSTTLWLGKFTFNVKAIAQAAYNGLSEFVMQISLSLTSALYMYQLLRVAGENGVAAYGVIMYFAFTFCALFIGYGIGSAPVISYHYGAKDNAELRSLLRKSLTINALGGIFIAVMAQVLAHPLCAFFTGYDPELLKFTTHAFRTYSIMFIVTGINIFASAFFTALNNGAVSALISMLRTIVFEVGCVLLLPVIFGTEGIWWAVTVAESITMTIALSLIHHNRKKYCY